MRDLPLDDFEDDLQSSTTPAAVSTLIAGWVIASLLPPASTSPTGAPISRLVGLELPGEHWIDPVKRALTDTDTKVETIRSGRRSSSYDPVAIADEVASGTSVTLLCHGKMPAILAGICDTIVSVPPRVPTPAITAAIEAVTGRPPPTNDARLDHIEADLPTAVAAIRHGTTIEECLERLQKKSTSTADIDRPEVPTLDHLVGCGKAAIDWSKSAVEEISKLLSGNALLAPIESAVFYGPPGTGKTTLANVIAKSAQLPLLSTSVGTWLSEGEGALGDTVRAIGNYVEKALASAPCVAFIDEIDALPGRQGMTGRGREWWSTVVTRLLLGIETLKRSPTPIILLAATNRVGDLDPALIRAGRFDRLIEIPAPTTDDLTAIMSSLVEGSIPESELRKIAIKRPGATGADVRLWVDAAFRSARDAGRTAVTMSDISRYALPVDTRSKAEREAAACHEAGHAFLALRLGVTVKLASIVAGSSDNVGGVVEVNQPPVLTPKAIADSLSIAMGGRAADEICGRGPNAGAAADLAHATRLAAWSRVRFGLAGQLLHLSAEETERALVVDPGFRAEVERDLTSALERARNLIGKEVKVVTALAEQLLEHGTLDGDEIANIVKKAETPGTRARESGLMTQ